MKIRTHDFAAKPMQIRKAIEAHKDWIERQLGASLSEVVILETDVDLTETAAESILGCPSLTPSTIARRLRQVVLSAEVPNDALAMLRIGEEESFFDLRSALDGVGQTSNTNPVWQDCPVAIHLRGITSSVVAINVAYRAGISSDCEQVSRIVLIPKNGTGEIVRLLQDLTRSDREPRLHVFGGHSRRIISCEWSDLVLDPLTVKLLKDDFEAFFERESWFRQHHLPFRRGYLLHGPPGNGKSTAIRAMMTSRGLTAYTMRLFDPHKDDDDLDRMFEKAWKTRPSMVLFEDLDRAFPKTGQSKSNITLQQLLNCLDGVGTGEGIIVVATANEPALLDPAILRRPGRFDRVVHFPNLDAVLRAAYFRHMGCEVEASSARGVLAESDGFSFAQLREAYILGGQQAFERNRQVTDDDLLDGIRTLRQTVLLGSNRSNTAGFIAGTLV